MISHENEAGAFLIRIPMVLLAAFGAVILLLGAMPGTVLANSAAQQYIEPEIPHVPGKGKQDPDQTQGGQTGERTTDGQGSESGHITAATGSGSGGSESQSESGEAAGSENQDDEAQGAGGTGTGSGKGGGEGSRAAISAFAEESGGTSPDLLLVLFLGVPVLIGTATLLFRVAASRRRNQFG